MRFIAFFFINLRSRGLVHVNFKLDCQIKKDVRRLL